MAIGIRVNNDSCAAASAVATAPCRTTSSPRAETARRGRNGEIRCSSRSIGSCSRSPLFPAIPPPRTTSAGSSDGHDGRDRERDPAGDPLDDRERAGLATAGGGEDALRRRRPQPVVARGPPDRGGGRGLLQLAAAAVGGVMRVAGADGQIGDLARRPGGAPVQLAVDDDPEPDPGADPQEHEAVDAAADAARPLAESRQVDVVLERDLRPQLGRDRLEQPLLAAGQVRAEHEVGGGGVEHARQADGGVRDARPVDPALPRQAVGEGADLTDRGSRGALRALVPARPHRAGDVGECRPHPVAADVDPDHPA